MGDAEAQVREELERIVSALGPLTGLPSRWNGSVELVRDARVLGRKPFDCHVVINERLVGEPVRWRTLIHEALHSFSAGYNSTDYQSLRGWEEGVVEQLQRLLRPGILQSMNVEVEEAVFEGAEAGHPFNPFIAHLESLRLALSREDEVAFYAELLATPIRQRPGFVFGLGNLQPTQIRIPFIRLFSVADAGLKERPS